MRIAGLQKLTLLDFPGRTAATVFTAGCNFRCPFCHNADLVLGAGSADREAGADDDGEASPPVTLEAFFAFLDKRRSLLDGVCVTGGEPLMQPGIGEFCARVKERGFEVKLDTNGSFPERLRSLVDEGLVDYVAMDVKNAPERYAETTGANGLRLDDVRASMDLLRENRVPFEFRTTVVRELHTESDLLALARWIGEGPAWFLQSYLDAESVLAGSGRFHAWDPEMLHELLPRLQAVASGARLRGVD